MIAYIILTLSLLVIAAYVWWQVAVVFLNIKKTKR